MGILLELLGKETLVFCFDRQLVGQCKLRAVEAFSATVFLEALSTIIANTEESRIKE